MTAVNTEISQFYIPESRLAFIKKVQASLSHGKIAVIEGSTGTGKTVLLEETLTQTYPDANKCYLTAVQGMGDIQVRSRIIEQLFGNVLFDPELPLLTSFIEFNQAQQMLITIDNCQFLSGRIVGELLQLFSEAKNLQIDLSICLALDKSLNSTLLNVNSSLVQVWTIPALNRQESYQLLAEYIEDLPAQTNNKVKRWIENSAGLPIQLLAYSDAKAGEAIDNAPLNVKLWGSLLVLASLVLALGLYVYNKGATQAVIEPEPIQAESRELTKKPAKKDDGTVIDVVKPWKADSKESKPQSAESDFSIDEKPMAQVVAMPAANSQTILADIMGELEPQTKHNEPKSIPVKDVEQNPTTDLILSELTTDTVSLNAKQRAEAEAEMLAQLSEEQAQLAVTVEQKQVEPIKQESLPEGELANAEDVSLDFFLSPSLQEDEPPVDNISSEKANIEPIQLPEDRIDPNIITSPTEQADDQETSPVYNIDNQIFMSLPRDRFVLQMTAVSSEEVLSEYLASAPVSAEDVRIYRIQRNQKDWIVVTYGLFESIELARQEAKRIEPNAWAKSISVIQQQILAFQQAQEQ